MRGYGFKGDVETSLRPKGDRIEREDAGTLGLAAAAGRTDVLGPVGMLSPQGAVGNAGVAAVAEDDSSPVHDLINSGGGSPLPADTRADMEARFGGQDFSDVRIHTDGAASESAKAVNAHAYTVGSNVVFQHDAYDPASDSARHMLAHELTHVVQQRNDPVDGNVAGGDIKVSDPMDRFERQAIANADRIMSDSRPVTASPAAAAVQRCGDGLDESESATAQTFVQRQAEDLPEEEPPAS